MKLIHLSDLHLGKRVNEYSMIEDQKYILMKIINIIDEESPAAVLIAGDIYDKSIPTAEAVELFDEFLVSLAKRRLQVFIISGNHDSPERLAFGNRLMDVSGIHIAPVYKGEVYPITVGDREGEADIYMLPFIKPATVRRFFPEVEINSYTDAVAAAIGAMKKSWEKEADDAEAKAGSAPKRRILLAHQFVTGAARSESEEISVGGLDNVDASVFDGFDYVALGHIHGPQNFDGGRIRYCGTPLKYSFSEAKHEKSVTVVELGSAGELSIRTVPLIPKRDMVELRGTYEEVMRKSFYENTSWKEDYTRITLTNETEIPDALGKLRVVYRNLMRMDYDNARTRNHNVVDADEAVKAKTPAELFADFYELQNHQPMNDEQSKFISELIEKIWEDEK